MRKYLYIWIVAFSLFSCQNQSKQEIAKVLKSLRDFEVVIPSDLVMKSYCGEHADSSLLAKPYKMIVYLDAQGCEGCKILTLSSVYQFILDIKPFDKFGVIIILNPSQVDAADHLLEEMRFHHTVFYDAGGSFERLNPYLPKDEVFHTFLIDENNKVLLVGNPVRNAKLKKLYIDILQNVAK